MSGGSYDYLFCKDLSPASELLERMAERLRGLGHPDLADRTASVYAVVEALASKELKEVWRCVEWFDSNDYSREQVQEAVEKYRESLHG